MSDIAPMEGKRPHVAAYVRVSDSNKQGDNSSKETQIDSIKRYCDYQRFTYEVFIEEESAGRIKNNKRVSRPILEDIMDRLNRGEFQFLVITKTDRLVRDYVIFGEIVRQSDDNKWHIICTDEPIDTRVEMGKMMLGIMVAFATTERTRIKQRIMEGCKRNRVAAKVEGVAYSTTSYMVTEDLKRTITYLFLRRKLTLREIVRKFNRDKVQRPVEKYKDVPWDDNAVRNLLIHLQLMNCVREQERKSGRDKAGAEILQQYQDVKQILAVGRKRYAEKKLEIAAEKLVHASSSPTVPAL